MPSLSYFENFDSVFLPDLPEHWLADTRWYTASASYRSSPYSLRFSGDGAGWHYATLGLADGSSTARATIEVSCYVKPAMSASYLTGYGLTFRGSDADLSDSDTFYSLEIQDSAGEFFYLILAKRVAGVRTVLATVLINPPFGLTSQWYKLAVAGSFGGGLDQDFRCYLIRDSDGYSLNSSGSFVSSTVAAITSVDGSITTGERCGLLGYGYPSKVDYFDDFTFESASGTSRIANATDTLVLADDADELTNMLTSQSSSFVLADLATQIRIPGGVQLYPFAVTTLLLNDQATELTNMLLSATGSLVLAGTGANSVSGGGPLTFNVSAADSLVLTDLAAKTGRASLSAFTTLVLSDGSEVESVNPIRVSAANTLVLDDEVNEDVYRIVTASTSTSLVLADSSTLVAIRVLSVSAATTLELEQDARPGARLTIGAAATTTLTLEDVDDLDARLVLSKVATTTLLLTDTDETDYLAALAASATTTLVLTADISLGSDKGLSSTTTLILTDLASEVGVFVRPATDTLVLSESIVRPGRVINVSAITSLGLSGPAGPGGTWWNVGSSDTMLVLTGLGVAGIAGRPASSGLVLSDVGVAWLTPQDGTVVGGVPNLVTSGLSKYPFTSHETSDGTLMLANGIDPVQRWDPDTGVIAEAGVPAPTTAPTMTTSGVGLLTGKRAAMFRYLDAAGRPGNPSPLSAVVDLGWEAPIDDMTIASGYATIRSDGHGLRTGDAITVLGTGFADGQKSVVVLDANRFYVTASVSSSTWVAGGYWVKGVSQITYTVPQPAAPVARIQILRNLESAGDTWYVDVDSTAISTTYVSTRTDDNLSAQEPVPLVDGTKPYATRYAGPPSHHSVITSHSGVLFMCGYTPYREGNIQLTSGSRTVTGVQTRFLPSFVGRMLYTFGARPQEIVSVESPTSLTLRSRYPGPSNLFAAYSIAPDKAQQRTLRWSEPDNPEAWPAWNSLMMSEEEEDAIVGAFSLGPYLYVVKDEHIYKLVFQDIDQASLYHAADRGCVSFRCYTQVEGLAYMLDEQGIYSFNGTDAKHLSNPIQDMFHQDGQSTTVQIDWDADRTLWHAVADPVRSTIRWFVTMVDHTPLTTAICYDYRLGRWWLEEYPWPVSASVQGGRGYQRSLAGIESRRIVVLTESSGDLVPAGGTVAGTVTGSSTTTLSDDTAAFATGLAGTPVGITTGDGRHQVRIIASNSGQTLTLTQPWTTVPAAGDRYEIGGVHWTWRSGWLKVEAGEQQTPSDVNLTFRKPSTTTLVDMQVFYDYDSSPRNWALTAAADGITTQVGKPYVSFDLAHPRATPGFAFHRMAIHSADLYSYSEQYLALRLDGVQGGGDLTRLYGVGIRGVSQE